VQEDGLLAYWSFDDADGGDVALDQTGHGFGARLRDATLVPGRFGKALLCDGNSAASGVEPALFPEQLTVSCWVRTDQPNQSDRWFLNSIYGGSTDCGYRLGITSGARLCWGVPETDWSHHLAAKEPFPIGRWVHVAATADNNAMRLYLDGKQVAEATRTVPVGVPEGGRLTLGTYEHKHRAHFIGLLDEVRIYNRVLAPEEIRGLTEGER
jgi:hypothetical protein